MKFQHATMGLRFLEDFLNICLTFKFYSEDTYHFSKEMDFGIIVEYINGFSGWGLEVLVILLITIKYFKD